MRMHIELDDDLVREVDRAAGPRGRSAYVRAAVERAVAADRRATSLRAAAGALKDIPHEWDEDPATWVRAQRHADPRRAG